MFTRAAASSPPAHGVQALSTRWRSVFSPCATPAPTPAPVSEPSRPVDFGAIIPARFERPAAVEAEMRAPAQPQASTFGQPLRPDTIGNQEYRRSRAVSRFNPARHEVSRVKPLVASSFVVDRRNRDAFSDLLLQGGGRGSQGR